MFEVSEVTMRHEDEFWALVAKSDGCWIWQGATYQQSGYGRSSKDQLAHRVAYALTYGPFDERWRVYQSCGNVLCCNPDHLYLGPGRGVRGTAHHLSKLTAEDVREIRRLLGTMSSVEIGRMYGVGQTTIGAIACGRSWAWLEV